MSPALNPAGACLLGTVGFRSASEAVVHCLRSLERGLTHSGCKAYMTLYIVARALLGVGLFENAAQSGW